MDLQTAYVRSADGTTIATHRLGRGGTPLVVLPTPFGIGTFSSDWRVPAARAAYSAVADRRLVVAYDTRGQGLSDAAVADYSLDARVADLAAVVESTSPGAVNLFASGSAAPTAIRFAAEQPLRVNRMILWHGVARVRDLRLSPSQRALTALIDVDWPLYLAAMAIHMVGWDNARLIAEGLAEYVHRDPLVGVYAHRDVDVSDLLASVQCPTLVTFLHEVGNLSIEAPRRVAAGISGARFNVVDGRFADVMFGTADEPRMINEFLQDEPGDEHVLPSGTAVILFADIVDSTALTERMGDRAFRERARALDAALRGIISEAGGATIDGKTLGDGVLATFAAASQAIKAAVACASAGERGGLPLHVGVHAGDVMREANNVFGGAVNIASRISGLSAPGEVLVSRTVADLARTSAGVAFEDRGEHALKGVADPVRVFAVVAE